MKYKNNFQNLSLTFQILNGVWTIFGSCSEFSVRQVVRTETYFQNLQWRHFLHDKLHNLVVHRGFGAAKTKALQIAESTEQFQLLWDIWIDVTNDVLLSPAYPRVSRIHGLWGHFLRSSGVQAEPLEAMPKFVLHSQTLSNLPTWHCCRKDERFGNPRVGSFLPKKSSRRSPPICLLGQDVRRKWDHFGRFSSCPWFKIQVPWPINESDYWHYFWRIYAELFEAHKVGHGSDENDWNVGAISSRR